MASPVVSEDNDDLLYPELLTEFDLISILAQRYIKVVDLEKLEKEDLLSLYYKYIIPLPQRKYRNNRRGQAMTKKQLQLQRKRSLMFISDSEPPKKKSDSSISDSSFFTSFSSGSVPASDRLKPPPSCINFDKKVIKIGSKLGQSKNGKSGKSSVSVVINEPNVKKRSSTAISSEITSAMTSVKPKLTLNKIKKVKYNDIVLKTDQDVEDPVHEDITKVQSTDKKAVVKEKNATRNTNEKPVRKKQMKIKRIAWP